jgi:hypothetical protein
MRCWRSSARPGTPPSPRTWATRARSLSAKR